jgi:hypothetical protein
VVAVGTTAWLLVDGDETEMEDDDDDEEVEAQRDAQLRAAEVCVKAATEVERVAEREAEEREAAERATHWAAEMDKALAYQRDVDRSTATRCAEIEHRIERRMTVRR